MRKPVSAVAACAVLAAFSVHGAPRGGAVFKDAREAYSLFSASTNAVLKEAAYAYVKSAVVKHPGELAARDELGWLRTMSRVLDKSGDCLAECSALAASTNPPVRMAALVWMFDVARGWDADKATALVDRCLAAAAGDDAACSFLFCRRMEARRKASDVSGANDAAAAVMSFGNGALWTHYSQACFYRAETAVKRGDSAEAEKLLARLLDREELVSQGIAKRLAALGIGRELAMRFVSAIRERISGVPVRDLSAFRARAQTGEAEIIELLVYAGRLDEALGECRIMLLTAVSQTAYGNAVRLTADVLKRIDGNLGRASLFLDSQRSNHVAAAVSPLPAYPAVSDPVRKAEREKCLAYARENASDWNAQLVCANRLLWADCAEDSIRVALDAFALAPFAEKDLQTCADAVMHPVSVMTRDPGRVVIVRDYLLYGIEGRDGVAGTADDLPHPAELYRSSVRKESSGAK